MSIITSNTDYKFKHDMSSALDESSNNKLETNQQKDNDSIRITESMELPITTGKLEVDTSKGAITIFMKQCPPHKLEESLIITKISRDNNIISLFSETTLINNAEIIIFGLPVYAKVKKGKVRTLHLKCDGNNWKIIREE